jgi:ribose transport system substrate-binding protein
MSNHVKPSTSAPRTTLRRSFAASVAASAIAAFGMTAADAASQTTYKKEDLILVTTVINATNPYMASWIEGSKALGEKLGIPVEVVQSNGSSQQEIAGIQALAAKGKKIVLVTNPIAASDVPAIANTVKANGGYMVVWWNMPPNYEPEKVGDHFVAFGTYNGFTAGKCGAEALAKSMNGKGGVIALPGVLDSTVSQDRYQGLVETLKSYPDIKLLDTQPANWDQAVALKTTQQLVAKHGDAITGVWTADDAMMLGAYEAIKKSGRIDQVRFSGEGAYPPVIDLLVNKPDGDVVAASAFHRGYKAAATGLLIAYKAAIGEVDISQMTPDQRHGQYAIDCVTPANAKEFEANGGIKEGWLDGLIANPFQDLVGGPVVIPK